MKANLTTYTVYLGSFLLITGLSYLAFSRFIPKVAGPAPTDNKVTTGAGTPAPQAGYLNFSGPKTEVCPLNGTMHTKEEKDAWSDKRPLLVMVENHADSRPQSGLNNADIVYEAVAEGAITRFMAVYYCNAAKTSSNRYDVGPVRSARIYFMNLASEYGDYPLYAHVGGANCSAPKDPVTGTSGACTTDNRALAIERIGDWGWTNKGTWGDLNQFSLSYRICRREPERTGSLKDTEHTMYCSTQELWNIAKDRGLSNLTPANKGQSWDKDFKYWSFKQKDTPATSITARRISFDFWSGYKDYAVSWQYNETTNNYLRSNGGSPHIDFNSGEAISAKNIVVQFTKETRSIDVHMHNLYELVGTGTGILFQNGTKSDITWTKASRNARTIFKDASGKEVNFVPGSVWIEIVPLNSKIDYEG